MKYKKEMEEKSIIVHKENEKLEISKNEKLEIYNKLLNEKTNKIQKKIICKEPLIYSINRFLSSNECDHLINLCKNKLNDATLSTTYGNIIDKNIRNNKICWLDHNETWVCEVLCKRLENIIKIPLSHAEKIQIVYYKIGEKYDLHTDSFIRNGSEKSNKQMKYGGQRIFTCLIYLNDVESGGETYFSEINHTENPNKGKLIIFRNVDNKNDKNELTRHKGCVITKGEKYAINLWFRESEINIDRPFKYVPLKKYYNELDSIYNNALQNIIHCEFDYVSNNKDDELKILHKFANIHMQNNYIIFININLYNFQKYLLINTYMCNFDLNILNSYYNLLSEQYIKNDIISRVIQYELLQYFNVFTNKKLRPLYCEFYNKNILQNDIVCNYCILINLGDNILHKSEKNIYLEKNGLLFIDKNSEIEFNIKGMYLIMFYELESFK